MTMVYTCSASLLVINNHDDCRERHKAFCWGSSQVSIVLKHISLRHPPKAQCHFPLTDPSSNFQAFENLQLGTVYPSGVQRRRRRTIATRVINNVWRSCWSERGGGKASAKQRVWNIARAIVWPGVSHGKTAGHSAAPRAFPALWSAAWFLEYFHSLQSRIVLLPRTIGGWGCVRLALSRGICNWNISSLY